MKEEWVGRRSGLEAVAGKEWLGRRSRREGVGQKNEGKMWLEGK